MSGSHAVPDVPVLDLLQRRLAEVSTSRRQAEQQAKELAAEELRLKLAIEAVRNALGVPQDTVVADVVPVAKPPVKAAILDFLGHVPGATSDQVAKEVMPRCQVKRETVTSTLSRAVAGGEVRRDGSLYFKVGI